MYSLLIVDDEKYSVQGISRGIDWSELQITSVFEAYNSTQAIEICRNNLIDVMLCDIEMPDMTGIELLESLQRQGIPVKTIFLSAHAKFDYAQKGIQIGCFEYLLKPVDFERLKTVVGNALKTLVDEREDEKFLTAYKQYFKQWETQFPALIERFWCDVLSRNITINTDKLKANLELYSVNVSNFKKIVPILLNIEYWNERMEYTKLISTQSEEVIEYGVRELAIEIVLKEYSGTTLKTHDGNNLILIYCNEANIEDLEKIKQKCKELIDVCSQRLQCNLNCYMGDACSPEQILQAYESLLKFTIEDISELNTLVVQSAFKTAGTESISVYLEDWTILFEVGKEDELYVQMDHFFNNISNNKSTAETLEGLYYSILNSVYHVMHKNNILVERVFGSKLLKDGLMYINSINHMRSWAFYVFKQGINYLKVCGKNNSAVIERVKTFVADHMNEKFTREDIALRINLNPAYLSRIFRKETGISLTEYILSQRIECAKELLTRTNDKISTIAESLGYYHFSHFAKIFKEFVGIGPSEYRRKFQSVSTEGE